MNEVRWERYRLVAQDAHARAWLAIQANLGRALKSLHSPTCHVATKVRLTPEQLDDCGEHVRRSVQESLDRLGLSRLRTHAVVGEGTGVVAPAVRRRRGRRPGGVR